MRTAPSALCTGSVSAAVAGIVAATALPAAADPAIVAPPRAAALSWVREPGTEDCPAGPAISAEVERVLGGAKLTSLSQAEIVIEGRVARTTDGFETVLTVTAKSGAMLGTRKLTTPGTSCNAITGDAGLVIALMIDPDATTRPPHGALASLGAESSAALPNTAAAAGAADWAALPNTAGTGRTSSATLPNGVVCAPPAPVPVPFSSVRGQLSVGAVMGAGLLPAPGFGVRGRISITPPRLFPLEIGGEIFGPVRVELAGRGVTADLAQAFVRACPIAPSIGRFALAGCLGIDLGSLRGAGFGFAVNRSAELAVVAAALGARADVHAFSVVHASLGADLSIPFFRGRFYYDAAGGTEREAFLTAPIAGTIDLSIGLGLP